MLNKKLIITLALLSTLVACNASTIEKSEGQAKEPGNVTIPQSEGVIDVSNDQLQKLLDDGVTLIDIRLPEEWAQTGVVLGSKKLTFFTRSGINPNLVPELKALTPADKPVALICRTGNRTNAAAKMLTSQLGYKTVYNVKHGITKWIAEDRKTVK